MIRIGQGFDVHQFSYNRKLVLGGIEIPFEKGLLGHSDADVLLHALADAILGALAKGDIGKWYPDSDPSIKGIDSKNILSEVWQKAKIEGYSIGNSDITIIAERPKLAGYTLKMQEVIAEILECKSNQINIKATTSEKMGYIGREEGIAALAIVLLIKSNFLC
ncbi:MAG: 2-C-methyl-D-erythritol 2,4-cyclodiphosphate synthase [Vulcanibacillus sp.]